MDTTQAADTTGIWITKAMDLGVEYGLNILWVVLIFMIGKFVAGRLAKATIRALERANVDKVLSGFAGNMVRYAVITFTLIACLGVFGVETTSFVAVLAAAGFAIGLAFQGTLSNFSSGVMLLFFRPFNVGDVIDAGGVVGAVQELQLFTTIIKTPDNVWIAVPNGAIYGSTIKNMTREPLRRVDVGVGVAYDCDIDEAKRVLIATAAAIPQVVSEPGVDAYLKELGGSSVDFQVRAWCAPADYWAVREQLLRRSKQALDAAAIGIPFPQLDLHVVSGGPTSPGTGTG